MDEDGDFQRQLDKLYWSTELGTQEIAQQLGVRDPELSKAMWKLVTPQAATGDCERCGATVRYTSRAARTADRRDCIACGHRNAPASCECPQCTRERIARNRAEDVRRKAEQSAAHEHWASVLNTREHAVFALGLLSPASRGFYHALVNLLQTQESVKWSDVVHESGVASSEEHIAALHQTGLISVSPETHSYIVNTHGAISPSPATEDQPWLYWVAEEIDAGELSDDEVWEHAVEAMPELAAVDAAISRLHRPPDYSDRRVWRDGDGAALTEGIRRQVIAALESLPPSLRHSLDGIQDALLRRLASRMPTCRAHSDHPPVAASEGISAWADESGWESD